MEIIKEIIGIKELNLLAMLYVLTTHEEDGSRNDVVIQNN